MKERCKVQRRVVLTAALAVLFFVDPALCGCVFGFFELLFVWVFEGAMPFQGEI